ncbi:unnamed protein product [Rhizophagus irregularis]|nr:unnamed protein product [Rhizophagus irregularis]
MEEEFSEDTQTSEFTYDDCNNIACENFIIMWAKQQGFQIIKDRVVCLEGIICRRTYIYFHSRTYESNSTRDTVTKKIGCPFVVILLGGKYYDGFSDSNMTLCLFNQYNNEFCEDILTIMEQKLIYGKLHGILSICYKNSQKMGESDFEELNEINKTNPEDEIIDKENVDPLMPILRNLKKRSGKGRPLGTKRFKTSTEAPKPKSRNK